MKKHDENRDLKSVARISKINYGNKTIQCSKAVNIGIHMWGRIDFLIHYCGWHFIWNNSAGISYNLFNDENTNSVRSQKKAKKEPKLTDKTKKVSKKK